MANSRKGKLIAAMFEGFKRSRDSPVLAREYAVRISRINTGTSLFSRDAKNSRDRCGNFLERISREVDVIRTGFDKSVENKEEHAFG